MPSRCDSVCCLVSSYLEEHAAWRSVKSCSISLATKRKAGASTTPPPSLPLLRSLGKSRHPNMTTRRRHPFHDAHPNSPCRQLPAPLHVDIDMCAKNSHSHDPSAAAREPGVSRASDPCRPDSTMASKRSSRSTPFITVPITSELAAVFRSPSLRGGDLPT